MRESIVKDEGMTLVEKLFSIKRIDENERAYANDIVIARPDLCFATDGTGPLAIRVFEDLGAERVFDPSRIKLFIDHTYPASDVRVANLHKLMRNFSRNQGIELIEGNICHQYVLEKFAEPGMFIAGADSHTPTAGSVGALAIGLGSTDMALIWATGENWFRVPETIKVVIRGELRKGVFARDVASRIVGELGPDGGTYKAIEFSGDVVDKLSISGRATICNMVAEVGAKTGIVAPDEVTRRYIEDRGRRFIEISPGREAEYSEVLEIDGSEIEPLVAKPYSPANVVPVSEVEGLEIDQAFIGSCTGARLEDLEIAARIVEGRKVRARFIVTPASQEVYKKALERGIIEKLVKAGAIVTNPTCGACVGTHLGILADGEVCISSTNRNFRGRMGSPDSLVYLASPATVAASAIEGKIADPRRYL